MKDTEAQLIWEAFQQANEADNPFAAAPLDEEGANRILSEFGFVAQERDPRSGIPDDGSVHWSRETGELTVDDTAFVDPVGNPDPDNRSGAPVPPGVLVRLSNPERRTWDDYKFTFGQNTVEELQSVLTPKAPPAEAPATPTPGLSGAGDETGSSDVGQTNLKNLPQPKKPMHW